MDEFGLMHRADLNSSDTHTGPVISADPTTTRTETGLFQEDLQLSLLSLKFTEIPRQMILAVHGKHPPTPPSKWSV
ncbi:hypothetical protein AV530_006253 [Patagioenas fasciata monilis]|uniref:Uncharacterized protein n=1 Tax=Patagioenas fasciata monilis TaxID=372326 RepID=A0A1V4KFU3_PATFA|nr:hypothetical protein AV530_006253 [Patagioenas fasciata monilis]